MPLMYVKASRNQNSQENAGPNTVLEYSGRVLPRAMKIVGVVAICVPWLWMAAAQRVLHPITDVQLEGLIPIRNNPLFLVSQPSECESQTGYTIVTNDPDSQAEGSTMTLIINECEDLMNPEPPPSFVNLL